MPVMKFTHTTRIDTDFYVTASLEAVVDTTEEAFELGKQMAEFNLAFVKGFAERAEEEKE